MAPREGTTFWSFPRRLMVDCCRVPLQVGTGLVERDWLLDKYILALLNQPYCYMEVDESRAWIIAPSYIGCLAWWLVNVESGRHLDKLAWQRRHTFIANFDEEARLHWFVCALDCYWPLSSFTSWVWDPMSSTLDMRFFFKCLKALKLATIHKP